jgi:hypothetical protein
LHNAITLIFLLLAIVIEKNFIDITVGANITHDLVQGSSVRDGMHIRADPHILVVGDPGLGKSQVKS